MDGQTIQNGRGGRGGRGGHGRHAPRTLYSKNGVPQSYYNGAMSNQFPVIPHKKQNGNNQNGNFQNGSNGNFQNGSNGNFQNGNQGNFQNGNNQNGNFRNGNNQNGDSHNGNNNFQNGNNRKGNRQNGNNQNGNNQNGNWQNGNDQNGNFQNGNNQNGNWQNGNDQNGNFQNGNNQNGNWQNGNNQNGNWQNGNSQNGNFQNDNNQNGNFQNGKKQKGNHAPNQGKKYNAQNNGGGNPPGTVVYNSNGTSNPFNNGGVNHNGTMVAPNNSNVQCNSLDPNAPVIGYHGSGAGAVQRPGNAAQPFSSTAHCIQELHPTNVFKDKPWMAEKRRGNYDYIRATFLAEDGKPLFDAGTTSDSFYLRYLNQLLSSGNEMHPVLRTRALQQLLDVGSVEQVCAEVFHFISGVLQCKYGDGYMSDDLVMCDCQGVVPVCFMRAYIHEKERADEAVNQLRKR